MASWPRDLDEEVDRVLRGRVLLPLAEAWRLLGIRKSLGFTMIARGDLERVRVSGRSGVTARSLKKYLRDSMAQDAASTESVPAEPPLRRPG
jgi:hypothetical protein